MSGSAADCGEYVVCPECDSSHFWEDHTPRPEMCDCCGASLAPAEDLDDSTLELAS